MSNVESAILHEFLPKAQAAKELKKTEKTLDRWDAASKGPPRTYIGREPYYSIEGIKAWLLAGGTRQASKVKRPTSRSRRGG